MRQHSGDGVNCMYDCSDCLDIVIYTCRFVFCGSLLAPITNICFKQWQSAACWHHSRKRWVAVTLSGWSAAQRKSMTNAPTPFEGSISQSPCKINREMEPLLEEQSLSGQWMLFTPFCFDTSSQSHPVICNSFSSSCISFWFRSLCSES